MPRTSTCCFCIDLVPGSALLAIYYLYEATLFGGYSFWQLTRLDFNDREDMEQRNMLLIAAALALIHFMLGLALATAIWLERPKIIFIYLYVRGFSLFLNLCHVIAIFSEDFEWGFVAGICLAVSFGK